MAELDGSLVGTVTLADYGTAYADIARPGETEFRMLAVQPSATGQGVATALVLACEGWTRERGGRRLVCSVEVHNTAAQQLYHRLGYVRVPARDWAPVPEIQLRVLAKDL